MNYSQTWFSKQPMTHIGGFGFGRISWLHHYVEVIDGGVTPMHKVNADGSIDVLGVNITRMSNGMSFGSYNKEAQQKSLAKHAEKLKEAGATIIKHTKNRLVARYKNETAYYVISQLTTDTFYKKEWGEQ
jgi:hypothetical protein